VSAILDKLLKGQKVEWLPLNEIVLPTKNIKWKDVDSIYQYIDLTSVDRKTNAIIETSLIDKENAPSRAQKIVEHNDIIFATTRPTQMRIAVITEELHEQIASTGYCILRADIKIVLPKWIYYNLSSVSFENYLEENESGSAYPAISDTKLKEFKIPIPPLDVQAEIVRILDAFTAITAELTQELAKEKILREKQYQYYRDKLLSFSKAGIATDSNRQQQTALCEGLANNVKQNHQIIWKSLGEVVKMQAGKNIKASQIHPSQTDENLYPCFGGNGIRGYVNNLSHQGEYVIIGRQGALCGNVQRVKGNFYATEHAVVVTVSDLIDVDWAYHMLSLMNLNQYASKSAQPGLAVGKLEQLEIPVPSLSEQKRVAKILDKLDTITHSITQGLPKEITLRQRQYEYYREQLIDFPKN